MGDKIAILEGIGSNGIPILSMVFPSVVSGRMFMEKYVSIGYLHEESAPTLWTAYGVSTWRVKEPYLLKDGTVWEGFKKHWNEEGFEEYYRRNEDFVSFDFYSHVYIGGDTDSSGVLEYKLREVPFRTSVKNEFEG